MAERKKRSKELGISPQMLGAEWERQVISECDILRGMRRANIERIHPPMARTGREKAYSTGGSTVDFDGHMVVRELRGRRVCFDTKSTESSAGFSVNLLATHQHERLMMFAGEGVITFCYVVWHDEMRQVRYIIPVDGSGRMANVANTYCRPIEVVGEPSINTLKWADLDEAGLRLTKQEMLDSGILRLKNMGYWSDEKRWQITKGAET